MPVLVTSTFGKCELDVKKKSDGTQNPWDLGFITSWNDRWVFQLIPGFHVLESKEQSYVRGDSE